MRVWERPGISGSTSPARPGPGEEPAAQRRSQNARAFGVDEIACPVLALPQIVFFVWVTLDEHRWVILLATAEGKG